LIFAIFSSSTRDSRHAAARKICAGRTFAPGAAADKGSAFKKFPLRTANAQN
jgi:hypothetical protein